MNSDNDKKEYVPVKTFDQLEFGIPDDAKEIESDQEEENIVPELNDIAILSLSKVSLNKQISRNVNDEENVTFLKRCEIYCENLPLKGSILAVLCALLTAIASIFTKMNVILSASDIAFVRYIIQFTIMFVIIRCKNTSLAGPLKHRKLLIFRAFIGTTGLVTFFFSFKLLDPSDCLAITHTSIIITAVLARIFLKEKLTFAHIFAVLLTATGVFFIARPRSLFSSVVLDSSKQNYTNFTNQTSLNTSTKGFSLKGQPEIYTTIGVIIALSCALSSSTVQVMLKKLSVEKVHFTVPIIFVTYVGIPVSAIISIILVSGGFAHQDFIKNINLLPMEILYTVISGLIGTLSQVLLNISLKYEDASKVVILRSLDVFITFFFQYLILNIKLDIFSILGSCAILLGSFIILSFKLLENKTSKGKVDKNSIQKKKSNPCLRAIMFKF